MDVEFFANQRQEAAILGTLLAHITSNGTFADADDGLLSKVGAIRLQKKKSKIDLLSHLALSEDDRYRNKVSPFSH